MGSMSLRNGVIGKQPLNLSSLPNRAECLGPLKLKTHEAAKGVYRQYRAQFWSQGLCWRQAYWSQMALEVPATAAENSAGNYSSCS